MTIITHPLLKEPLERWWQVALVWLVMAAGTLRSAQSPSAPAQRQPLKTRMIYRRKRKKVHHGAALQLPGYSSMRMQEVLAAAIVWARGEGKAKSGDWALFIQKVGEWTAVNVSHKKRDVRPYYSYSDWCRRHFPWHDNASMQRMVQALEAGEGGLGLIITEQDPGQNNKKRYALNVQAIQALVDRWADVHPDAARFFRGESGGLDSESGGLGRESGGSDSESPRIGIESHTTSNQGSKRNAESQAGTNGRRSSRSRAAASKTDSHSHAANDAASGLSGDDPVKADSPAQGTPPAPLPLTPLSPSDVLIAQLHGTGFEDRGEDTAAGLIARYGVDRVTAVMQAAQRKSVTSPTGWICKALEGNWNVDQELKSAAASGFTPLSDHISHAIDDDWDAERLAELEAREHIKPPEPVGVDEIVYGRMTASEVWNTGHHQLSLLFDRPSFDMWLKTAKLLAYADGVYTVGVPTAHAQDMLQNRYYRKIQRVFEGLQNTPVEITFTVWMPPALDQMPLDEWERVELAERRDGTWADQQRILNRLLKR